MIICSCENVFGGMKPMVKIKDIAEKCGVSVATVSKALNNSHEISEKTTQHITRVANELGYIANSNARSLKTNRSYNLGLLYVDKSNSGLEHEYFNVILNSIKKEAERLGYDVTFISNKIGNSRNSYLSHARYRGCDGVVLVSADFHDPEVIHLVESNMPTVIIDHVYHNRTAILSDRSEERRVGKECSIRQSWIQFNEAFELSCAFTDS